MSCLLPLLFPTEYRERGAPYGSVVEADNLAHAHILCAQRGLNERVVGMGWNGGDPGVGHFAIYLNEGDYTAALHAATFMIYLALSSRVATPREVVGDRGLVHEIIHLMQDTRGSQDAETIKARCLEQANDLAGRIPGWPRANLNAFYAQPPEGQKDHAHASS